MDTALLVLVLARKPLLASDVAAILDRSPSAVRATLARLEEAGLAMPRQVGTRGPVGTFEWVPTTEGASAVDTLSKWVSKAARS